MTSLSAPVDPANSKSGMFREIIFPVDLAHADFLEPALLVAAGLSRRYDAPPIAPKVTATMPRPLPIDPRNAATS